MNKYGREVSIEILVGLFMFTVLIALGVFTIVLSRDNFFSASHQYEFVFNEVSGLREGESVYLRGVNIGNVKQTMLEDNRVGFLQSSSIGYKNNVLEPVIPHE